MIQHGVSAHLYADDTQIYLPFTLTQDESERLVVQMDCIDDICRWINANNLLNLMKTRQRFLPSRKSHQITIDSLSIVRFDVQLQPSKSVKNLGVYFDSSMLMTDHIFSVIKVATINSDA